MRYLSLRAVFSLLPVLAFRWFGTQGESGTPVTCLSDQYMCIDGFCIPERWRCDGDSDCIHGGDEEACETLICAGFQCNDGHCVALTHKCDGFADCADKSDEDLLTCGNLTCTSDKFRCNNGQCMSARLVCNGHNDCKDGSDEVGCQPKKCSATEFPCGRACVSLHELCDRKPDCLTEGNNLEEICKQTSRSHCLIGEFICNERCVPQTWKCDGHTDCEDGSDEENCGLEPFMLTFNTSGMTKVDLVHDRREDFPLGHGQISSLSGNLESAEIFWIDAEQEIMFRTFIGDQTERRELIGDVGRAKCLSVDWIYQLIFWIEAETQIIAIASLDGSKRKVLYEGNISIPSAVAVDPLNGFLFWADMGEEAKIEKTTMNGHNRSVLVNVDILRPVALSLDINHSYVYWVDTALNTIYRIGMDGSDRRELLHSKDLLRKPSGIAVFKDKIYWSDAEQNVIYSMQSLLCDNITRVSSMKNPVGLIILAKEVQVDGVNMCIMKNAKCPFLCVPSPSGSEPSFSCLVSDNFTSSNIFDLPQSVNTTIGESNDVSSKWRLGIALSVISCVSVMTYIFIHFYKKTSWDLLNIHFIETSKTYLKPDRERTTSTTYMLAELKNEEGVC